MLGWTIIALLLLIGTANSQQAEFETSLISVYRAISLGESKKALLFYETQAQQFEDLAKSGKSSKPYWEAASRAYREASNAAHYLGNLQKAIIYGERALALAEKLGNPRWRLPAISSLEQAFRSTRNFTKAREFTDIGLKVAQEFSPNTINRLWWDGVFFVKRAHDFRRQAEYEKAVEAYQDALTFKKDYLKRVAERGQQVEDRREHARTSIALAYRGLGDTYLSMEKPDRALEIYKTGLKASDEWALEFPQTGLYLSVGNILHSRKDFAGALDNFQKALRLAQGQQWSTLISNVARRIGDVLRDTGKGTETIVFYQQAIREIESVRSLLASEQNRQSYFGGWLGAYQGMTETLWETGAHE